MTPNRIKEIIADHENYTFAGFVQAIREERGLSRIDVCIGAGRTAQSLFCIEKGKCLPRPEFMLHMAQVLDIRFELLQKVALKSYQLKQQRMYEKAVLSSLYTSEYEKSVKPKTRALRAKK